MNSEERAEMTRRLEAERLEARIESEVIKFRAEMDAWEIMGRPDFPGDGAAEGM